MHPQTHTTQATKAGTSNNSSKKQTPDNEEKEFPTQAELSLFLDEVAQAKALGLEVEAPMFIVRHFNRMNQKAVLDVGYFIYNDVKIYVQGRKDEAVKADQLTTEEKVFGVKKP